MGGEESAAHAREDYNWFLCVLFPAAIENSPLHRLVLDLNGHSPADFLAKVKATFGLEENAAPTPASVGRVKHVSRRKMVWPPLPRRPEADPVARLDVSVLQTNCSRRARHRRRAHEQADRFCRRHPRPRRNRERVDAEGAWRSRCIPVTLGSSWTFPTSPDHAAKEHVVRAEAALRAFVTRSEAGLIQKTAR